MERKAPSRPHGIQATRRSRMATNAYLKGVKEKQLPGFKPIRDVYEAAGIKFSRDQDRWFYSLNEVTGYFPEALKDVVEEFSFRDWIRPAYPRETGIYIRETARAEVERDKDDIGKFQVCITAKKLEDLRWLLADLKVGSIRPDISYEHPQGGRSRQELEAEITRLHGEKQDLREQIDLLAWGANRTSELLQEDISEFRGKLTEAEKRLEDMTKALRIANIREGNMHGQLDLFILGMLGGWPLVTKKRVRNILRVVRDLHEEVEN